MILSKPVRLYYEYILKSISSIQSKTHIGDEFLLIRISLFVFIPLMVMFRGGPLYFFRTNQNIWIHMKTQSHEIGFEISFLLNSFGKV